MTQAACSPLRGGFDIAAASDGRASIRMTVQPTEPVFAGHYPGFPILPGVCVIEFVRQAALATIPAPDRCLELAEISSARFLGPVFPGDMLTADLQWTRDGAAWRCLAAVTTQRGPAARIRVSFAERTGP